MQPETRPRAITPTPLPPPTNKQCLAFKMGQGVSCDTRRAVVGTGTLFSCCAIAMINPHTSIGGMYHYPAMALTEREQYKTKIRSWMGFGKIRYTASDDFVRTRDRLLDMLEQIRPHKIYIVTADAAKGNCSMGTAHEDIVALKTWFLKCGCSDIQFVGRGCWAGFDGKNVFTCEKLMGWNVTREIDLQDYDAGTHTIAGGLNVTLYGKNEDSSSQLFF